MRLPCPAAAERLGGEELHLGVRLIRVHETGRVHLHAVHVDGLRADGDGHLDAVARAVVAVRGGLPEQVRTVLRQEAVLAEVRAEAAGRDADGALHLLRLAALHVLHAAHTRAVREQLRRLRLHRDLRAAVLLLRDRLQGLHQRVRDGHARELLLAAVRAGLRVAAEAGHEGEVELEVVLEPLDARAGLVAQHLGEVLTAGAATERVRDEDLRRVRDARVPLRARHGTVDAARRLRAVPAEERVLVQDEHLAAGLEHGVGRGEAAEAAANHDHLVRHPSGGLRAERFLPT